MSNLMNTYIEARAIINDFIKKWNGNKLKGFKLDKDKNSLSLKVNIDSLNLIRSKLGFKNDHPTNKFYIVDYTFKSPNHIGAWTMYISKVSNMDDAIKGNVYYSIHFRCGDFAFGYHPALTYNVAQTRGHVKKSIDMCAILFCELFGDENGDFKMKKDREKFRKVYKEYQSTSRIYKDADKLYDTLLENNLLHIKPRK